MIKEDIIKKLESKDTDNEELKKSIKDKLKALKEGKTVTK